MDTSHLSQAFQDGLKIEDPVFGEITWRHQPFGDLILTSGQVVACDPLVFPETSQFVKKLSPGRYPVVASIAELTKPDDRRVAYVLLRLDEQEPIRWEMATRPGQDSSTLKEGTIFGYPVDAGLGCFMDADAAPALIKRLDEETYPEDLFNEVTGDSMVNLLLDAATGANCIAFTSGWGDGFYASYWGYDAEDNITCLVTDFDLLRHRIFHNSSRPTGKLKTLARRLLHL